MADKKFRRDGTATDERQSARGYSWPPFEAGNKVSVRHGAFSEVMISERAQRVRQMLTESYPYLGDPLFVEALERYCRAEARARMLDEHITRQVDEQGLESVKPYLWSEASRADANAQKFGQEIGLDPTGHVRIARDLGLVSRLRKDPGEESLRELARTGHKLRQLRGREE